MSWLILEKNGEHIIGLTMTGDGEGNVIKFDTEKEAERYAKRNCAFEYVFVEV